MENEEKVIKEEKNLKEERKNNVYHVMTIIALVSSVLSVVLSTILLSVCVAKPNYKNRKAMNNNKTQVERSIDNNKSNSKNKSCRRGMDFPTCPNGCSGQGMMCPSNRQQMDMCPNDFNMERKQFGQRNNQNNDSDRKQWFDSNRENRTENRQKNEQNNFPKTPSNNVNGNNIGEKIDENAPIPKDTP